MEEIYYRMVTKMQMTEIKKNGRIVVGKTRWEPYEPDTIVNIFKSKNIDYLCERYASAIADNRDLQEGEDLYLLELNNLPGTIEKDKSAGGWPESYTHLGDIPENCIKFVRTIELAISHDNRSFRGIRPAISWR
ncbi:MAG: hypothetical protein HQ507_06875 [Candidatus Marinimicrobia bacterium]|nr:hypothetical protein [Candidatus Neomarinimicrobiota bacterium]